MRYQLLGNTGLRVSKLFLGTATFGEGDGSGAPRDECLRMLDAYADAGGNVVDTAINYRGGESESMLGELLGKRRDRFVVATKYTASRDPSDPNAGGNHRKNLVRSLETSLRRLRTDYIDLYWVHVWDVHTPIQETMRALDDVVRAGKVLYLGISDTPAWVVAMANTLAEWRGWTSFAGLQVPYSLIQRDVERELLPMAEASGMLVAAWSPLARGILSGKFTASAPIEGPTRIDPKSLTERHRAIAVAVQDVAKQLGATPAQVAIAWTMAKWPRVHPILGARTVEQLTDNLAAADLVLPTETLPRLEDATDFSAGFPTDFLVQTSVEMFGDLATQVDGRQVSKTRIHSR